MEKYFEIPDELTVPQARALLLELARNSDLSETVKASAYIMINMARPADIELAIKTVRLVKKSFDAGDLSPEKIESALSGSGLPADGVKLIAGMLNAKSGARVH